MHGGAESTRVYHRSHRSKRGRTKKKPWETSWKYDKFKRNKKHLNDRTP